MQHVNATVPVPRVRLADFARVHVAPGATRVVQLVLTPRARAAVVASTETIYADQRHLLAGALDLAVGGGQPDFDRGVLRRRIAVVTSAPLASCP